MRERVRKLFMAWEFEEEEKWLNLMAADGKVIVNMGIGYYDFERTQPGEYSVRMEMLSHWPSHPDSQEYIRFVEETGAEYVCSMKNWVCFRKKTKDGPFALYSDRESKLNYVKRFILLLSICCVVAFVGAVLPNLVLALKLGSWQNGLIALCTAAFGSLLVKGLVSVLRKKKKLEDEGNLYE